MQYISILFLTSFMRFAQTIPFFDSFSLLSGNNDDLAFADTTPPPDFINTNPIGSTTNNPYADAVSQNTDYTSTDSQPFDLSTFIRSNLWGTKLASLGTPLTNTDNGLTDSYKSDYFQIADQLAEFDFSQATWVRAHSSGRTEYLCPTHANIGTFIMCCPRDPKADCIPCKPFIPNFLLA